jgi:hypothetical protein
LNTRWTLLRDCGRTNVESQMSKEARRTNAKTLASPVVLSFCFRHSLVIGLSTFDIPVVLIPNPCFSHHADPPQSRRDGMPHNATPIS